MCTYRNIDAYKQNRGGCLRVRGQRPPPCGCLRRSSPPPHTPAHCTPVYVFIYVYMHTRIYMYIYTYMYICMCVYISYVYII